MFYNYLGEIVFMGIVLVLTILVPLFLTIMNIYNLIVRNPIWKIATLYITVFYGMMLYITLYHIAFEPSGDWYEAIYPFQSHHAISSDYALSFGMPVLMGWIGLLVLGTISARRLPPLVSALCIAADLLGNGMLLLFFFQLLGSDKGDVFHYLFFALYHLNLILLSVQHIRRHIREQTEKLEHRKITFRYPWIEKLYGFLFKTSHMGVFAFTLIFPIAAILEILLVLFGQGIDGPVKAFTETAGWSFSQQIPPPPLEYDVHYLCTIAAAGHEKLVHPQRYGKRLGQTIIVNRQLCVANAFEELIHDRMPRFHRFVRHFYDTHGYPLSRWITNPLRADLIYLLMKPLEWLFLLFLYLFDTEPELRISKQYR